MHIENLLFILLIATAVLFRLLASKVGEARKRQQDPNQGTTTRPQPLEPVKRASAESDEERIRRFLEALGQPTGSSPPPPVVPRTDIPPRPLSPVQPPATHLPRAWKVIREERRKRDIVLKESAAPEIVERAEKISPPPITPAPAFEVHEGPLPVESLSPIAQTSAEAYAVPKVFGVAKKEESKTDIATLLASTSGLRDAIILREIFGPPRGMQRLEEMRDSLAGL